MGKREKLPEREDRFVDAFIASGNATHAARVAGYTGTDHVLGVTGSRLLTKARVMTTIAERSRKRTRANVAARDERQEHLTATMRGETIAVVGVHKGKPIFGPPSHDTRRKAAMDLARMNGELLDTRPAVDVNVNTRSVHVVVMVPPSKLGPTPNVPALEAGQEPKKP